MSLWNGKYGPLLIAEIGGNHEGNFDYAKKLCQLAIDSKADYVKFQLYTGDGLVSPVESPDRNAHFKKFELTKEQHIELAEMVINAGRRYTASVWNTEFIDWIDPYMDFYRIGSGDLTAYPVLEEIIKRKKPIIISTGLATEQEILDVVKFIQSKDSLYTRPEYFGILQCTSMYPIGYEDANLSVIPRLKELTGLAIGYSDHTEDMRALLYATAMGAEILEFHFTDTREGKTFRDHKVSLTREDVWNLIKELEILNKLKGEPVKKPTPIELSTNHHISFRRAAYFKQDIPEGKVIEASDLVYLRPLHGLDAREKDSIIGKKARVAQQAFRRINKENFE